MRSANHPGATGDAMRWGLLGLASLAALLGGDVDAAAQTAGRRHAGIEIGGKGVKVTVLEVVDSPAGYDTKLVHDDTNNTTVVLGTLRDGRFLPQAIEETADAVALFYADVQRPELGVGPDDIYIVGSSGLPEKASNRDELADAVEARTGLRPTFITPAVEAGLGILGVVPDRFFDRSFLVDVGSGNTKGGALVRPGGSSEYEIAPISISYGTVTLTDEIKGEAARGRERFAAEVARAGDRLVADPLRREAGKYPLLRDRDRVYLIGGVTWAMATLMFPERSTESQVAITRDDIVEFNRRLKALEAIPLPDLSQVADPEARERAEGDLGRVVDAFSHENLIAGSEILVAVADAFDLGAEGKEVYFDRYGFIGWIRAFATMKALGTDATFLIYPPAKEAPPELPDDQSPVGGEGPAANPGGDRESGGQVLAEVGALRSEVEALRSEVEALRSERGRLATQLTRLDRLIGQLVLGTPQALSAGDGIPAEETLIKTGYAAPDYSPDLNAHQVSPTYWPSPPVISGGYVTGPGPAGYWPGYPASIPGPAYYWNPAPCPVIVPW